MRPYTYNSYECEMLLQQNSSGCSGDIPARRQSLPRTLIRRTGLIALHCGRQPACSGLGTRMPRYTNDKIRPRQHAGGRMESEKKTTDMMMRPRPSFPRKRESRLFRLPAFVRTNTEKTGWILAHSRRERQGTDTMAFMKWASTGFSPRPRPARGSWTRSSLRGHDVGPAL